MLKNIFNKKVNATEESNSNTELQQNQDANQATENNSINSHNSTDKESLESSETALENNGKESSIQGEQDEQANNTEKKEQEHQSNQSKEIVENNENTDNKKKGFAEYSFNILASISLLTFLVFAIIPLFSSNLSQNIPPYSINYTYVTDSFEQNYIAVYEQMKETSQWLVPPSDENIHTVFPAYIWLIYAVDSMQNLDKDLLYTILSILSTFVAVAGVYTLSLAIGFNNKISFAAGLIFMSSLGFISMANFKSVDFFWTGLLCFSLALLYRGWINKKSSLMLIAGFILTAISALTIGLNGLIIPLLSSLIFIIYKRLFNRAHQKDAILGFTILLIILLAWFSSAMLFYDSSNYFKQLGSQLKLPLNFMLNNSWYIPTSYIACALIPWLFIIFFAISKNKQDKAQETNTDGFIWIGICLFVIISNIYLNDSSTSSIISIIPIGCIFFAKILTNLTPKNSTYFFSFITVFFILIGLSLSALSMPYLNELILNYTPMFLKNYVLNVSNLYLSAFLWIFASLVLIKFTRRNSPTGALLVTSVLFIILMPPIIQVITPEININMARDTLTHQGINPQNAIIEQNIDDNTIDEQNTIEQNIEEPNTDGNIIDEQNTIEQNIEEQNTDGNTINEQNIIEHNIDENTIDEQNTMEQNIEEQNTDGNIIDEQNIIEQNIEQNI